MWSWDVDIDPSFPKQPPKTRIIETDFLGDPAMETKDWIADGPLPAVVQYLRLPKVLSEDGPWIMLDGSAAQEDENRGRYSSCSIRSFLVRSQDAASFVDYLNRQNGGIWDLRPKPSVSYTFAGEIPWCSTFPYKETADFSHYQVLPPVCDFGWEYYHSSTNDTDCAMTLAKEVAIDLELVGQPQTFDLFTRDGLRATRFISDRGDGPGNNQSAYFIREELLRTCLKKNDCSLIWIIWGERRYSARQIEKRLRGANRPEKPYEDFGWVERYD